MKHVATRVYGLQYVCKCGWRSSMWQGKGAQKNAAAELRRHKEDEKQEEGANDHRDL